MKKNKVLLMSLLLFPLLVGCSESIFTPKHTYPGDPLKSDPGVDPDNGDVDDSEKNMLVYFYLDYSHSEAPKEVKTDEEYVQANENEPIFVMSWYMLKPLGACPERAVLTNADAKDPLYTKFLGYSEYPSCIDESKIWNFETDYKQSNILNLYGVWVAE